MTAQQGRRLWPVAVALWWMPTVAASAFYAVGWFACAWSVVVGASTIAFSQPKALFANLVR